MDKLGEINGELLHRHYSEDTFQEFKQLDKISSLTVITYVSIGSLKSTLKYIYDNFISKSKNTILIFGITGLSNAESEQQFNDFTKQVNELSNDSIVIYLHSRCHIKALCADNLMYLGTQNVSSTANLFVNNANLANQKQWGAVFNYHELIIRVNKSVSELSTNIVNTLIDDTVCCYKFYDKGLHPVDFISIREQYNHNRIIESCEAIQPYILELLDNSQSLFDIEISYDEPDFTPENAEISLQSISLIYDHSNLNSAKSDIEGLLELTIGDGSLSCLSYDESDLEKLISDTEWLIEISESGGLPELLSSTMLEDLEPLLEQLRKIKMPCLFELADDIKEDLFSELRAMISNAFATDVDSFIENNMHDICNHIEGSPGDYLDITYEDNDGNLLDDAAITAIYNGDISTEALIFAAKGKLGSLITAIADLLYGYIKDEMEVQADELKSIVVDLENYREKLLINVTAQSKIKLN